MYFRSGDIVSCSIKGYELTNVRVHITSRTGEIGFSGYICHNNPLFSGSRSPEMYGFPYSWQFNQSDGGRTSDGVTNLINTMAAISLKKDVIVEEDLLSFFRIEQESILTLFHYKFGIFDEYNVFSISKNSGFIKLSSKKSKKIVEIKIGRFIKQMIIRYNQLVKCPLNISDQKIESIHNKFVSFQKNDQIINFLSGQDILEGYRKENYPTDNGSVLHKSCMVDRFSYLGIYTENPNQVQLATISIDSKIVARAFVWTTIDGEKFYDRIYFTHDWLNNLMSSKLEAIGIKSIQKENFQMVQLENWKFKEYPYLDHFYYFNVNKGTLMFLNIDNIAIRSLRNTDGRL